ncbi:MAG: UMP kinase [Candidatus Bathyarchaeia archaeon]
MRLVIRVGGSVVASPLNPERIAQYADVLRRLRHEGHEIIAVVGGGAFARNLIQLSERIGLSAPDQDWVAIQASRVVAQMLAGALSDAALKEIPPSARQAARMLSEGKIVVMGGLAPGMTTDAVAALIAGKTRADLLVKATDQEGVYTKDPRKHPDAVKLDRIAFTELQAHMEHRTHQVGIHQVLDPKAAELLTKVRVKTVVLNGLNPQNIEAAVRGERIGTLIE